jgi:hypothetical protein
MEVNGFDSFNIYCGPAVLSIFTGARVDDCAEEIGKVTKAYTVKGVYVDDLMKAGEAMGLKFEEIPSFRDRSIFWAGTVLCKLPPSQYLVTIAKHYLALEVRDSSLYICDNHTKSEIELTNSSRLSQKIERVWKVTRVREYSKPRIVKTEFGAERSGSIVDVRAIHTMSDDGIKIIPLGSFQVNRPSDLREIAFALMELADKI